MKGHKMKATHLTMASDDLHETLRTIIINHCVAQLSRDSAGHLLDKADKIEIELYLQEYFKHSHIRFVDEVALKASLLAISKDGDIIETAHRKARYEFENDSERDDFNRAFNID